MSPAPLPHRAYPCDQCPFRADNCDNPASHFPAEDWERLKSTSAPDDKSHPGLGDPLFSCHKGEPGTNRDLACAGWLATFGPDHTTIRIAVARGGLPARALTPGPTWPPLHGSWAEVVRHHTAGPRG